MADISQSELVGVLARCMSTFRKKSWTDLAVTQPKYVMFKRLVKGLFKKKEKALGKDYRWKVRYGTAGSARNMGVFAEDVVPIQDSWTEGVADHRFFTANYAFSILERDLNDSAQEIINLINDRHSGTYIDMADLVENNIIGKPSSTTDKITPWGLKYWLTYNATEGFNGTNSTFDRGGISESTYTAWRHYTFQYTNIDEADVCLKLDNAIDFCQFEPPYEGENPGGFPKPDYEIFVAHSTKASLRTLAKSQNDNLGLDILAPTGQVVVKGVPFVWWPKLDALTSCLPFIGLNWNVMKFLTVENGHFREHKPKPAAHDHNRVEMHIDGFCQPIIEDVRQVFFGAKSDTGWNS